eukprot:TRINITY_DN113160_c0_g1_i1.p1 TRINITY_DN113160_c0_g1~~TRINITY_DN113160_c0_g1_i1.p1  ORF type:complete len:284 (+),score=84.10 TRINITY_DN113160_c0_g1_i1:47-898(+)
MASWWESRVEQLELRCKGLESEAESCTNAISRCRASAYKERAATQALQAEADSERKLVALADDALQKDLLALDKAREAFKEQKKFKARLCEDIEGEKLLLGGMISEADRLRSEVADKAVDMKKGALPKRKKELEKSLMDLGDAKDKLEEQASEQERRRRELKERTRKWLADKDSEPCELERQVDAHPAILAALQQELQASRDRCFHAQGDIAKLRQHMEECSGRLIPRSIEAKEVLLEKIREMTAQDDNLREQLREAQDQLFQRELRAQERKQCVRSSGVIVQ